MNDANQKLSKEGLANLAIDPDLLARELAAQLAGDPLAELELDKTDKNLVNASIYARKNGINVICYDCKINNEEIIINNKINYEH